MLSFFPVGFNVRRKCKWPDLILYLRPHLSQWSAPQPRSRPGWTWRRTCNCWIAARRSAPGRFGQLACRPLASGLQLPASTSHMASVNPPPHRWCWHSLLAWFHYQLGVWRSEGERDALERAGEEITARLYSLSRILIKFFFYVTFDGALGKLKADTLVPYFTAQALVTTWCFIHGGFYILGVKNAKYLWSESKTKRNSQQAHMHANRKGKKKQGTRQHKGINCWGRVENLTWEQKWHFNGG